MRGACEADEKLCAGREPKRRIGDECPQRHQAGARAPRRDRLLQRDDVATTEERDDGVRADDVARPVDDEAFDPRPGEATGGNHESAYGDAAVEHRDVLKDDAGGGGPRRTDPKNGAVGGIGVGPRSRLADQGAVRGAHLGGPECPGSRSRRREDEQYRSYPQSPAKHRGSESTRVPGARRKRGQGQAQGLSLGRVFLDEGRAPDGNKQRATAAKRPAWTGLAPRLSFDPWPGSPGTRSCWRRAESLAMLAALHFGRLAEHDGATDPSGPRIDAVELARTCSQRITLAEPA